MAIPASETKYINILTVITTDSNTCSDICSRNKTAQNYSTVEKVVSKLIKEEISLKTAI